MSNAKRDEWLRLMTELAVVDRETYRELRAEAWSRIVKGHKRKSQAELAAWRLNAS
jgi:hypothetical protein